MKPEELVSKISEWCGENNTTPPSINMIPTEFGGGVVITQIDISFKTTLEIEPYSIMELGAIETRIRR